MKSYIQTDVAVTKEAVGDEHHPVRNIAYATGGGGIFQGFFEAGAKVFGRTASQKFENRRAEVSMDTNGRVEGAVLPIDKPVDIDLKGIDDEFIPLDVDVDAQQVVSTMRSTIGTENTNKVLKEAKASGVDISDITPDIITTLQAQGKHANFDEARARTIEVAEAKAKELEPEVAKFEIPDEPVVKPDGEVAVVERFSEPRYEQTANSQG